MIIRQYHPSDLESCRALWAENVQRHRDIYGDPSIGGEEPGLEFDAHLENVGPERIWLAEDGGKPAGMVSLILDGEQAEVEPIIVSTRQRGKGAGRKLVQHVIGEARNLGVLCLYAKPVARNEEAMAFFHRSGFDTLGHLQLLMWLGESPATLWKPGPEVFGLRFQY